MRITEGRTLSDSQPVSNHPNYTNQCPEGLRLSRLPWLYDTGHDTQVQRRALEIMGQKGPARIMRIYIYVVGKHLKGDCN